MGEKVGDGLSIFVQKHTFLSKISRKIRCAQVTVSLIFNFFECIKADKKDHYFLLRHFEKYDTRILRAKIGADEGQKHKNKIKLRKNKAL
jgi:hypothetical protein